MPTLTFDGPDAAATFDCSADPIGTATVFGPVIRCPGCGRPGVALGPTVVGHALPVTAGGEGAGRTIALGNDRPVPDVCAMQPVTVFHNDDRGTP